MDAHVNNICRKLNYELKKLKQLKEYLPEESMKTLVTSLIFSRLDYCNSLLYGMKKENITKLQRIQNNAARLVLGKNRRDSVTPMLQALHWLPVAARIEYKISILVYQCIHNDQYPKYLSELIRKYEPTRDLRSCNLHLLEKSRAKLKTYGERAFSHSGPAIWNKMPKDLKEI